MARIVIAGEQAHIRHVLAMWLSRYGHDVTEAATGADALAALRERPADVLITDLNLRVTGHDRLLPAALGLGRNVRRVFVLSSAGDQRRVPARGADPRVSFLPAPFSPSQLLVDVAASVDGAPLAPAAQFRYQATMPEASGALLPSPTAPGGDA
jgi:CheY-like chemotaxis protein